MALTKTHNTYQIMKGNNSVLNSVKPRKNVCLDAKQYVLLYRPSTP